LIIKRFYSLKYRIFSPPKLQCHRGYWVDGLQQNSLASIQKAYELGYEMSEFDIRITKDEQVILFHDDFIGLKKVSEMTLAEVETHQKIDNFEAVILWFIKTKKYFLNVEIKSKFAINRTLEKKVLDIILKYEVEDRVLISSFNPLSLYFFRRQYPQILRALLLTYGNQSANNFFIKSQVLNVLARPHFLHFDEVYWTEKTCKRLLSLGVPIVLWTCNDLHKVKKYFLQGVYGVISDKLKPDEVKN
jgi:glycerophosphoryl diester phosphodiesterase